MFKAGERVAIGASGGKGMSRLVAIGASGGKGERVAIGDVIVFSSENNCMTNMEGGYVFLLGALCLHFIDLYNLGFVAVG